MFDIVKNAGEDEGYQLRITYNTTLKKVMVTGFSVYMDGTRTRFAQDGATLIFDSLEDAINHIINNENKI